MDRYVVPIEPLSENSTPPQRPRWKRTAVELNGRVDSEYRHEMLSLLIQSYSETGVLPHNYHINGARCPTHVTRSMASASMDSIRYGVSALDFDNQGIYLASGTKCGCLMVHDFESLYCQSNMGSLGSEEDESKHVFHIRCNPIHWQIDAVRWNPTNQDEVACTSSKSIEITIFDVAYVSSEPVEVLKKRPGISVHGSNIKKGLPDVAFMPNEDSRILACDTNGIINIWDRRTSHLPFMELTNNAGNALNSIQLNYDNQIVFGAGKQGIIYMWDLRGGRTSVAFQSHNEAYHPPMASVKVSSLLERIESLKAQSRIVPKDIQSISLDPSCAHRLAFHVEDGWSGVVDIYDQEVTHIHCPPPAYLLRANTFSYLSYLRKPTWLSSPNPIYAVGSSSEKGLHLLDFYPDATSPCHVDFSEGEVNIYRKNGFVPLSEDVTVCASHPLNDSIVAGTEQASLLMICQRNKSWLGDGGVENDRKAPH